MFLYLIAVHEYIRSLFEALLDGFAEKKNRYHIYSKNSKTAGTFYELQESLSLGSDC